MQTNKKEEKNSLRIAFSHDNRSLVDLLISSGANFRCEHGYWLLLENCKKGEMEDFEFLLNNGAHSYYWLLSQSDGMTTLIAASQYGYIEKVRLLLTYRYDTDKEKSGYVNRVNKEGLTALHLACMNKVKFLNFFIILILY
jgi:ankyrin repeat protein